MPAEFEAMTIQQSAPTAFGRRAFIPWAIALLALAISFGAAALVAAFRPIAPDSDFLAFNSERLAHAVATRQDYSYLVVILGDSRLKYATYDETEFADRLTRRLGVPAAVIRLVNNNAVFDDFVSLTPQIRALRPDLVVVQSELLVTSRPTLSALSLIRERYSRLLFPGVFIFPEGPDQETIQFKYPCWINRGLDAHATEELTVEYDDLAMQRRLSLTRGAVAEKPSGPGPQAARSFLSALAQAGTEVRLLDVPASPQYRKFLREEVHESTLQAADQSLRATGISMWEAPRQEPTSYCDLTHLTPRGRTAFSSWFIEQMASVAHPEVRTAARSGQSE